MRRIPGSLCVLKRSELSPVFAYQPKVGRLKEDDQLRVDEIGSLEFGEDSAPAGQEVQGQGLVPGHTLRTRLPNDIRRVLFAL